MERAGRFIPHDHSMLRIHEEDEVNFHKRADRTVRDWRATLVHGMNDAEPQIY